MSTTQIPTLEQMEAFVSGSLPLDFRCTDRLEAYQYIQQVAVSLTYLRLSKPHKGLVRSYLAGVTGYSPAQLSRLLGQYKATGRVVVGQRSQPTFTPRFNRDDIIELARIDDLHGRLNGAAVVQILKREYELFGNKACERLSTISCSHVYNLRTTNTYKRRAIHYTKTKPAVVAIGKRMKPITNGRPGHVRVDSVHQGDKDGEKGVYHINLVDEVTQYEVVVCVEGISQRFMVPALEAALKFFPFVILGFHADNGSEYMNQLVAELLERLRVKLTKSRPYHSGDNGLAETKNGAVIRKALGYLHIPRTPDNVTEINIWYTTWFISYLNFHRPCAYRVTTIDTQTGKRKHHYPKEGYMMPYEKLKSLPNASRYLKPDASFELLDHQAYAMSDTQWAEAMQEAKAAMWESLQF